MLTANSFQKLLRPLGLAMLIISFGLAACSPANLPATGGEGTPNEVPPQAVWEYPRKDRHALRSLRRASG